MENPTTVHRVWAGLSDAELLMATTYHQMAHKFCAAQIEDEPDGCALVYVDHYTGKMEIFRKAPVEVTQ
jgi:hypothetical protein